MFLIVVPCTIPHSVGAACLSYSPVLTLRGSCENGDVAAHGVEALSMYVFGALDGVGGW